jgi:rubredoxin
MSTEFRTPTIPKIYWVDELTYVCRNCGFTFKCLKSSGDYLVKFVEEGGEEVRWLPTYGEGGYLNLLSRLVPELDQKNEITPRISDEFQRRFQQIQERSAAGRRFVLAEGCTCPTCAAEDVALESERTLASPAVQWMRFLFD